MSQINPYFSQIPQSYLFSEIAHRVAKHAAARPDQKIIRMGIGDVTRPLCAPVIQALEKASRDQGEAASFHGYGPEQGYPFLRQAIQNYYRSLGAEVDAEDIFISDGAKSDLANLPELFSLDCPALITDPVYPVYRDSNLMVGRRVEYLDAVRENQFLPLPDSSRKAGIIYLCSPANPTGAAYTRQQLQQWVDYALEQDAVILYDAAYEAFIQEDLPRSIYTIPGAEKCAIEICSLSKTAGFTGMRCGYTVVPRALVREGHSLHDMWLRRQSTKMNGVAYPIQRAAEAVFSPEGLAACRENIALYQSNAACMARTLDQLGIWYCGGKNSPYVWMECPGGMGSWEFFDKLLDATGVVGTPGEGFGKNGEGYFRLSAFAAPDQVQLAMELLRNWLTKGD